MPLFPYRPRQGILFLENFPIENAGHQYRAAKWAALFTEQGLVSEVWTTCADKAIFEEKWSGRGRSFSMAQLMWKRFFQCIRSRRFETVIVRRELLMYNDYGNLFMERFLLAIHPNVVLDFDDDIGAAKKEPRTITSTYARLMGENGSKFYASLKLYKRFVVGSSYLAGLVRQHNPGLANDAVLVIPTCVDYDKYTAKKYDTNTGTLFLGWIGTSGNLPYLEQIIPALNNLSREFPITLKIISGKRIDESKALFPIVFKTWSLASEVEDIKSMDVGLMPLERSRASMGKCGFKLVQYMTLGVVSVANDITANTEIISDDGQNGFLVKDNEWENGLRQVLSQRTRFPEIGQAARNRCLGNYTFIGNLTRYTAFLGQKI